MTIRDLDDVWGNGLTPIEICIVLKANLTDCIKMDEEFIAKIKQDPDEYAYGFYEIGRYAWKLEDVEVLTNFKEAKGKQGIWEVKI